MFISISGEICCEIGEDKIERVNCEEDEEETVHLGLLLLFFS